MPRSERSFRVEAIVIRHADWGEADRILTIFTREAGKIRAIVKGARKLRSRKAGHLEPFTRVKLQLAQSRDLPIVTQAESIEAYAPLHEDLIRLGYGSYVLELVDRFAYEDGHPASDLFKLTAETLFRIVSEPDAWIALRHFELRVLDFAGFRPQLFHCANCENAIEPVDQFFSFASGGVICPRCGQGLPNVSNISVEALKYLRHFQRSTYHESKRAKPHESIQREVEALMQGYIQYMLERRLNTPGFIKKIKEG
jgi:DNA repair protein RecO (recombination protein O)